MQNKYYLAIRGCKPIEVILKDKQLFFNLLDNCIKQYGNDFLGLQDSYAESEIILQDEWNIKAVGLMADIIYNLEQCYTSNMEVTNND